MATGYVLFLLGLFSCANSHKKGETVRDNYLFEYWDGGEDVLTWCEATQACILNEPTGTLAVPKTESFDNVIFDLIREWGSPRVWLGGNDIHIEGWWGWIDGTRLKDGYTNWAPDQPDEVDWGDEDCLQTFTGQNWNDIGCYHTIGYVCQSDLTNTTKSNFVVLAFSDSFYEGIKRATSVNEAKTECQNKDLKLIGDVKSNAARNYIDKRLLKIKEAKYCVDNGRRGQMMGIDGILNEECVGQPFLYICEGFRPHYIKISNETPVVEESGNIKIECTAEGYPLPDVTWRKNYDQDITTDTNESIHQVMSPGSSTLVIKNAKQDDEDRYRCFAINNINGEKHSVRAYADLKVVKNAN